MQIALLSNPNSGRNKYLTKIIDLIHSDPEIIHFQAWNSEQFNRFIQHIKLNPVDVVAINAGDGTVQALLTLMFKHLTTLPIIAVLKGGTTNMTAGDVGIKGSCVSGLKTLIAWNKNSQPRMKTQTRPVLKIDWEAPASPVCGMFFGAGAIIDGQDYFHSHVRQKGLRDSIGPALSAIRILFALKNKQQTIFKPAAMQLSGWESNDSAVQQSQPNLQSSGQHLLAFASGLERLFLGIHPFWGSNNGRWYFTAVRHQTNYSLMRLLPLFNGKPRPEMTRDQGFYSAKLNRLELKMNGKFTVDGEQYSTHDTSQTITISHAGNVQFLQL